MSWLIGWVVLSVGVVGGFFLAALLRANGRDVPVPSATVTALSPQECARMGYALARAGDLLESGDLEYVSGGLIVQDLGHGVVSIKGDLSLRAVEHEQ
jgi:hypothetical protein